MMTQQHTMIPVKFTYNETGFETKALKYHYNREVLYKIALPSVVSTVQVCWMSKSSRDEWRMVMGSELDKSLMQELISAIKKQEQIIAMMPKVEVKAKPVLKSA